MIILLEGWGIVSGIHWGIRSELVLCKSKQHLKYVVACFLFQHYLSYLNNLRVQDVFSSTHSLLHYFDRLILTGAESKSNGEEGYGRSLRYAALNLAALHCRFGH